MSDSMLIAQITDCHVLAPGQLFSGRVDTGAGLVAAIEFVHAMAPRPDVVLATGDLVNDADPDQYAHLAAILETLEIPMHVVPGNHDDRSQLRALFGDTLEPGAPDERIDQVIDGYPLRLIGLDTTVPGEHGGESHTDQMRWLDDRLGEQPDRPTLIFQHHPPFLTGIAWMDDVGLRHAEREIEVLGRHEHVVGVICGHVHRPMVTVVAGTPISIAPSTGAQVALSLDGRRYLYTEERAGLALHHWSGNRLTTHVAQLDGGDAWLPDWAVEEP